LPTHREQQQQKDKDNQKEIDKLTKSQSDFNLNHQNGKK
jgi:hypothetical protein